MTACLVFSEDPGCYIYFSSQIPSFEVIIQQVNKGKLKSKILRLESCEAKIVRRIQLKCQCANITKEITATDSLDDDNYIDSSFSLCHDESV